MVAAARAKLAGRARAAAAALRREACEGTAAAAAAAAATLLWLDPDLQVRESAAACLPPREWTPSGRFAR